MLKSINLKEQKQNELQWWGEQRIGALHDGDKLYQLQCEQTIDRLTNEIKDLEV